MSVTLDNGLEATAANYSTGHFAAIDSAAYSNTFDDLYGEEDLRVALSENFTKPIYDEPHWFNGDEKKMAEHALDLMDKAKDGDQAAREELQSLGFFQNDAGSWLHPSKCDQDYLREPEGEAWALFFLNPDNTRNGDYAFWVQMPNGSST